MTAEPVVGLRGCAEGRTEGPESTTRTSCSAGYESLLDGLLETKWGRDTRTWASKDCRGWWRRCDWPFGNDAKAAERTRWEMGQEMSGDTQHTTLDSCTRSRPTRSGLEWKRRCAGKQHQSSRFFASSTGGHAVSPLVSAFMAVDLHSDQLWPPTNRLGECSHQHENPQ